MRIIGAAVILALTARPPLLPAQAGSDMTSDSAPTSPEALARAVMTAFEQRDSSAFQRLYPFEQGRALLRASFEDRLPTVAAPPTVLRRSDTWALLLLAGYLGYGNSGDETVIGGPFSGLYVAARDGTGHWRLRDQLPLGQQARLHSHRLVVDLRPDEGLAVTDSLMVTVRDTNGLALRLNHRAALRDVFAGGRPAAYRFVGGVLWIDAPRATQLPLVVNYTVPVATDTGGGANSGRFTPRYGHVRNQYFWHPFLWFDDAATFRVTVTAPASVHVATDLDQTDAVQGERRVVEASTTDPTPALSLFYDADWAPERLEAGSFRLAVFATPDFHPTPDSLARAFDRVVGLLRTRFGSPPGGYRAIVQQRARGEGSAGWPFMSNAVIAANWYGGPLAVAVPRPRAFFGHEVAHAWTHPTGPGRNFLAEGWATFAESLILRDLFGPDAERRFWEAQRDLYVRGDFDGRAQLTDDPSNKGVAYYKGAWVLRMLEDEIGIPAFDAGFRAYVAGARDHGSDLPQFLASMSQAAGRDVGAFLSPWLDGTRVPHIEAAVDGSRLIVRQTQPEPLFQLRLPIAIVAGADTSRLTVSLMGREVSAPLPRRPPPGAVIVVDPEGRFLLFK